MTTTGPAAAVNGVNDASIGSVAWSNPSNITADDRAFATVAPGTGNISNYLYATDFDLSAIPDSDDIDAIEFSFNRRASVQNRISDNTVRPAVSDTPDGDNVALAGNWGRTETTVTYGDQVSDTLGLTGLTGLDVKTNFGLMIAVNGQSAAEARADYCEVTIVHTAGVTTAVAGKLTNNQPLKSKVGGALA